MKSKIISTLFPVMLAMLMFAGAKNALAVDVGINLGGGHHSYRSYNYRTSDPVYSTWYSDSSPSYGYYDNSYSGNSYYGNSYYGNSYSTPYVYSSPSVSFGSWYGDGYRNHGGSYSGGRSGYGGGYRGGSSGGRSSGGGGSHGGGRK